jgi:hypothetical protein
MRPASQYPWLAAFKAAAFETDLTKLDARIDAALTAIDKRLDGTTKLDEAEFNEMQAALLSLHTLSTEFGKR